MLRGLSPKYEHTVPVITAKNPPHTFLFVRSYLLLEEQYDKEHAKSAAQHALLAAGSSRPAASGSGGTTGVPRSSQPSAGANTRFDNRGNKKCRGRGNNFPGSSSGGAPPSQGASAGSRPPSSPWLPSFNPWTDMVQAWPMPFRAPGIGVLSLRPGPP